MSSNACFIMDSLAPERFGWKFECLTQFPARQQAITSDNVDQVLWWNEF